MTNLVTQGNVYWGVPPDSYRETYQKQLQCKSVNTFKDRINVN